MISGAMELPVAGEHLLCDGGAALASGLALQELLKTMGQSGTDFRIADKTQFARGKLSIHLKIAVTIPQRSHLKALAMLPSVGNVSFGDDSF